MSRPGASKFSVVPSSATFLNCMKNAMTRSGRVVFSPDAAPLFRPESGSATLSMTRIPLDPPSDGVRVPECGAILLISHGWIPVICINAGNVVAEVGLVCKPDLFCHQTCYIDEIRGSELCRVPTEC